jgi:hypothetical protein
MLDNQVIVENGGDHGMEEKTGRAYLQKGWHSLKVVYYNAGGGYGLRVKYAPLDGKKQDLPAEVLAH